MWLKDIFNLGDIPEGLRIEAHQIISSLIESQKCAQSPTLIHLCGIPGSGKSTYAEKLLENKLDYILLSFDKVMECLNGYQQAIKSMSLDKAFSQWELPARIIGYHALSALMEKKHSFIFDHSAANMAHLELISFAKTNGYIVEIHYLNCDPLVALSRTKEREKSIFRHTPEQLIWDREHLLQKLLNPYKELADKFFQVDSGMTSFTSICQLN